jgi:hypothetical protein
MISAISAMLASMSLLMFSTGPRFPLYFSPYICVYLYIYVENTCLCIWVLVMCLCVCD